ncbi:MAG: hypothetical protein SGPRY_009897 [Prymnesium sp.]
MLHVHPELTLASDALVHSSPHAVIVLQVISGRRSDQVVPYSSRRSPPPPPGPPRQSNSTGIPLPYFSGQRPVLADTQNPTRHAIAGLASAVRPATPHSGAEGRGQVREERKSCALCAQVGNLLPPFESLRSPTSLHVRSPSDKEAYGALQTDFLWASGHHPFGPFSNATSLSQARPIRGWMAQVLVDTSHRHAAVGRLHAAVRGLTQAARMIEQARERRGFVQVSNRSGLPASQLAGGGFGQLITRYVHPASEQSTAVRAALARQQARLLQEESHMGRIQLGGMVEEGEEDAGGLKAGGVALFLHELHMGRLELSSEVR